MKSLLDPKIDFVFKKIFSSEENKDILISFLNSIIKNKDEIIEVDLNNTEIEKEFISDKFSKIDIKATTTNKKIVNIKIQFKDEYNITQRSLYYWSKLYSSQLKSGTNYAILNKSICINILNSKYLDNDKFHSTFRLKDINTNEELTDIQEIHFIKIPKLSDNSDEKDILSSWIEFLKNPNSEKVRKLEDNIQEIRHAKLELIKISNDDSNRALYEIRQKILLDEASALSSAKIKGIEEGTKKTKIAIAKTLLQQNTQIDLIMKATGLTIDEINKLK